MAFSRFLFLLVWLSSPIPAFAVNGGGPLFSMSEGVGFVFLTLPLLGSVFLILVMSTKKHYRSALVRTISIFAASIALATIALYGAAQAEWVAAVAVLCGLLLPLILFIVLLVVFSSVTEGQSGLDARDKGTQSGHKST